MLHIEEYRRVSSKDEALDILRNEKSSAVLGGCGYLRLGNRKISKALDLSALELDYIRETETSVEIGALCTLRTLETDELFQKHFGTVFNSCLKCIVGVQLRNVVTVGGTVAGKYPFSDVLPVFIALDAQVCFLDGKQVGLEEFINSKPERNIIEKIVIEKKGQKTDFQSVRNSETDYAMLNCSVSKDGDIFRVVVGARPGKAVRAFECEKILNDKGFDEDAVTDAAKAAAEEISFSDNAKASGEYRKAVCPVLIKRAVLEVTK